MNGKIALYTRLSKEDEFSVAESNSIINQRSFLHAYIRKDKELNKMEVVEFADDGYTGKNMERPDVQSMLALIKAKQIQCVVVKDFSRFSRDHIEIGRYIEQIFPFMGVRFIAVNDGYDSDKYIGGIGEIDVVFKQLLYDYYSEDLSSKVKSSLDAKRARGKYIATTAPYGYEKSKEDKHKLVIDKSVCEIVREIFREYLNGKSLYRIAKELNGRKIEPPGLYLARKNNHVKQLAKFEKRKCVWSENSIAGILDNEQYLGVIIYNKYQSTTTGAGSKRKLPKEEWKRSEKCHDSIVSEKIFKQVQEIRKRKSKSFGKQKREEKHCLSGKVVCGRCGHAMAHTYAGRAKYYCNQRYRNSSESECNISVCDEELESIVLGEIQKYADMWADTKVIMEKIKEKEDKHLQQLRAKTREIGVSIEQIKNEIRSSYERYRTGGITKEEYLEKRDANEERKSELELELETQLKELDKAEQEGTGNTGDIVFDQENIKLEKLTKELVDMFVEDIVLAKDEVEIKWKCKIPRIMEENGKIY